MDEMYIWLEQHKTFQFWAQIYFLTVVIVFIYGYLKVTIADIRLSRARARDKKYVPQFPTIERPDCIILLVHGTWALRSQWHRPDSPFIANLELELSKVHGPKRIQYIRFLWGGGNALSDRRRAIQSIYRELTVSQQRYPGIPHFIVCHSHGGNVVLKSLMNEPEIEDKVSGVFFIATPFILNLPGVVLSSSEVTQILTRFSRTLSLIFAASLAAVINVPLTLQYEANNREWIVAGAAIMLIAAVLLAGAKVSSLVEETTIPANGVSRRLFRKMVFIRASGDEASAALGAAYILRFAILASGGTLLKRINGLFSFGDAEWQRFPWWYFFALVIAGGATWAVFNHGGDLFPPWATDLMRTTIKVSCVLLVCGLSLPIIGALVSYVVKIAGMSIRTVIELCSVLLYAPIDFMSGILLLPFAPELILASARFGLAAEASVPCVDGAEKSALFQLSFEGRQLLNHSAYDHPDTPLIIASELMIRFRPNGPPPGASDGPTDEAAPTSPIHLQHKDAQARAPRSA